MFHDLHLLVVSQVGISFLWFISGVTEEVEALLLENLPKLSGAGASERVGVGLRSPIDSEEVPVGHHTIVPSWSSPIVVPVFHPSSPSRFQLIS